jgi:hypothetical protein
MAAKLPQRPVAKVALAPRAASAAPVRAALPEVEKVARPTVASVDPVAAVARVVRPSKPITKRLLDLSPSRRREGLILFRA